MKPRMLATCACAILAIAAPTMAANAAAGSDQGALHKLKVNGGTIEYEERGSGEAVLLIHGTGVAATFYPFMREPSMAGYRVIRMHRRGFAGSSRAPVPFSIRDHAADASALLRKLGVRRAHIVGHSVGGMVALQLALDAPELVESLVVMEPPVFDPDAPPAAFAQLTATYRAGDKTGAMDTFSTMSYGADWRALADRVPGGPAQVMADVDTVYQAEVPAMTSWRFGPAEAARITQPVLYLTGGGPHGGSLAQLRQWIPLLESRVLPNVTHAMLMQDPKAVADAVAGFVGGHPDTASTAAGGGLFRRDCALCHNVPQNARAPSLRMLRGLPASAIETALTTGKMAVQGQNLSPGERSALAEFVSGRALGAVPASAENRCRASSSLSDAAGMPAWNGWSSGPRNTRYQEAAQAGITAARLPQLQLAWAFGLPNVLGARTQPTVIGDWLFTASDAGDVYALDTLTGCMRWTFKADAAVRTAMRVEQVTGVDRYRVYFGDGRAQAYALDAQTGALLWKRRLDAHANASITAAPVTAGGRVYFAVSAAGEEVRGVNLDYACCTFRGSVTALNPASGEVLWKTYSIAAEPKPTRVNPRGVQQFGPAGAGIWGAPSIDTKRGVLYVGTGNGFAQPAQTTTNAILALDLVTGAVRWSRQFLAGDVWLWDCDEGGPRRTANCPTPQGPDFDFGSAPLIATTRAGRDLLIVPQKSGQLHALDPDREGAIVWQYRLGAGSALGGQWGAAADERNVYSGSAEALGATPGGMHAVDLSTGQRVWFAPPAPKLCEGGREQACSSAQGGALTAIPGVVFSGGADGGLRAYASEDGRLLWQYDTNRYFDTVNAVIAHGASMDAAGPVVAGGMLFVNSGYNGIVGRAGNVLLAFRVQQ